MSNSSDIRQKDVIDITDGKRLGNIMDMNFSPDGRISSISVPAPFSLGGLFKGGRSEIVIPWDKIVKIGVDVILVKMGE